MPHPLPSAGPPYTTDLRYLLVAIPDDPAFSRAANAVYSDLAYYWKWGQEGNEEGREEAAAAWAAAIHETYRLLDMGFPDTLLSYIDGVEALLQLLIDAQCCADVNDPIADLRTDDWATGDPVPQNIVDAGYATSTSDTTGMDEYKCMIAHVAAEDLVIKMGRFTDLAESSGAIPGGLGVIAGTLLVVFGLPALAGVLTAMTIGILQAAGIVAGLYAFFVTIGKAGMTNLTNELEDAQNDIACAIYQADGNIAALAAVEVVLEAAIGATATAALAPVIGGVIDALYAGRYDTVNTAQSLSDAGFDVDDYDCTCPASTDPSGTRIVRANWGTPVSTIPTCPDTYLTNTEYTWASETNQGGLVQLWSTACDNSHPEPGAWRIKSDDWNMTGFNSGQWGTGGIEWRTTSGGTVISTIAGASVVQGQWYEAPEGARYVTTYGGTTYTIDVMITEGVP